MDRRATHSREWRLSVDEPRTAAAHMACDARLAAEAIGTARFFQWNPPAVSLGFKQPRPTWIETIDHGPWTIDIVERPTGGGIAFHGSDVSISVVWPREGAEHLHDIMQMITDSAVECCRQFGVVADAVLEQPAQEPITYCLAQPSSYAVMVDHRKIAGFAIRRYPASWLIQGSLLVRALPPIVSALLPDDVQTVLAHRATALSDLDDQVSVGMVMEAWPRQYQRTTGKGLE
ncbi:MAG: hypothetical protein HY737_03150 [Candidatus Omnitrophica bacterium]|nr:hypothetical protein [Candidatus Omnitrophota bacterium]